MSQRVARMMSDEEAAQITYDEEMRRLRNIHFKTTRQLQDVCLHEKNVNAEIQGGKAAIRNLNSKIAVLDTDSLKQQEIIYNEDYTIQQLERRANRMQGDQSNEERVVLQTKINELNIELNKKVAIHDVLRLQLKRLQEDLRRVGFNVENSRADNVKLINKVEETELHNENSQRELNKITIVKQQLMVDKNMLQLDIRRLRKNLYQKAEHVHSLEHRKLQLMTAMKERHKEIEVHRDMILAQTKSAVEQKSQVSSELHERLATVDKLKKRYEIQIMAMAPPEGEEERSQAYYVIKAAQEKEELQRHGDELDAKIRKAEKEIRALENTLRLMNSRNETYRKSFNNVDSASEEMEQKHQLEEQLRAVMDKYKYKRRQIRELNEDLLQMTGTTDQLVSDERLYNDLMAEKQAKVMSINKEIIDQEVKLDRADKQNDKMLRRYRADIGATGQTEEEEYIDMVILKDQNKSVTKEYIELSKMYPECSPLVSAGIEDSYSSMTSSRSSSTLNSSRTMSERSLDENYAINTVPRPVAIDSTSQSNKATPSRHVSSKVPSRVSSRSATSSAKSKNSSQSPREIDLQELSITGRRQTPKNFK